MLAVCKILTMFSIEVSVYNKNVVVILKLFYAKIIVIFKRQSYFVQVKLKVLSLTLYPSVSPKQ